MRPLRGKTIFGKNLRFVADSEILYFWRTYTAELSSSLAFFFSLSLFLWRFRTSETLGIRVVCALPTVVYRIYIILYPLTIGRFNLYISFLLPSSFGSVRHEHSPEETHQLGKICADVQVRRISQLPEI